MKSILSDQASVVFLIGGLGAGKTELALNMAIRKARLSGPGTVRLVDLDIVNPYFRVRKLRDEIEREGVVLVCPEGKSAAGDLPALPPGIWPALESPSGSIVCDVGGGEIGLRILIRLRDSTGSRTPFVLFILNPFRPGFLSPDQMAGSFRTLSEISGLKVTHVVANPHLVHETTAATFISGFERVIEFAGSIGLPVPFAMAVPHVLRDLSSDRIHSKDFKGSYDAVGSPDSPQDFTFRGTPLFSLSRFWEQPWRIGSQAAGTIGPKGI